jgi:hypothetical protein
VQVGELRIHWHSLEEFQLSRRLTLTTTANGPRLGKAYCLGWGAICIHRKPKPGGEPDQHTLFRAGPFLD